MFARNGDVWSRQRKILLADETARDIFGTSVALDVDTALIGAPGDEEWGVVFGSAYVFDLSTDGSVDGVPDKLDLDPFDPNVGAGIEVTISRAILSSADDVEQRWGGDESRLTVMIWS